jgi:hypothetical protein
VESIGNDFSGNSRLNQEKNGQNRTHSVTGGGRPGHLKENGLISEKVYFQEVLLHD